MVQLLHAGGVLRIIPIKACVIEFRTKIDRKYVGTFRTARMLFSECSSVLSTTISQVFYDLLRDTWRWCNSSFIHSSRNFSCTFKTCRAIREQISETIASFHQIFLTDFRFESFLRTKVADCARLWRMSVPVSGLHRAAFSGDDAAVCKCTQCTAQHIPIFKLHRKKWLHVIGRRSFFSHSLSPGFSSELCNI